MSKIIHLQRDLQDTHAALATLEKAIAADPRSWSLKATAESLLKRLRKLEAEFARLTEAIGEDVCWYRLIPDNEDVSVKALASAFSNFQSLVSVVYDAVKSGIPKERGKLGAEAEKDSTLLFRYAFTGSLGVVLTVPNERLLLVESDLDNTFKNIFDMARSETPAAVLEFARNLGKPSIQRLFEWTSGLAGNRMEAEIQWRSGTTVKARLLLQQAEIERLRQIIDETSEESVTELTIDGTLVGANVEARTFVLHLDEGGDIRGNFTDAISTAHKAEIPKRYQAKILKTAKVKYSTNEEKLTYQLLSLIDQTRM
jgi:hypothetical protein